MTRLGARIRLFHIWQVTGKWPFGKTPQKKEPIHCPSCGTVFDTPFCPQCGQVYEIQKYKKFYKGSFDSIPFLNSDAKRTFVHLLLRPGYMIRDYIRGLNSSYLAPFTALIIFYAFLALVSSVASPYTPDAGNKADAIRHVFSKIEVENAEMSGIAEIAAKTYTWLHLDTIPEEVDTRIEQSVAAVEATLRSQGIPRFLGKLIALTLCIWIVFRKKYKFSFSASATTAAYILCQFCFFMLFAVLVSLGENEKISGTLTFALMLVDFHQLFGIGWKRSLWQTVKVILAKVGLTICVICIAIAIVLATATASLS